MSWLRIAITYALAALLTAHLVGVTKGREEAGKPVTAATTPFIEAVPERIDRVRIEDDSTAVQFERRDGRWVVTEPEGMAPPGDVVDAVLESLTSLPVIEVVSDGVEHEGQFGLVPPRVRIRLEQQGTPVASIVLGELSPTRTAVYAKKSGANEVVLIGLNSKYYIDLVFENVRRQRESAGAPAAAPARSAGTPAPAADGPATN